MIIANNVYAATQALVFCFSYVYVSMCVCVYVCACVNVLNDNSETLDQLIYIERKHTIFIFECFKCGHIFRIFIG